MIEYKIAHNLKELSDYANKGYFFLAVINADSFLVEKKDDVFELDLSHMGEDNVSNTRIHTGSGGSRDAGKPHTGTGGNSGNSFGTAGAEIGHTLSSTGKKFPVPADGPAKEDNDLGKIEPKEVKKDEPTSDKKSSE